MTAPAQADILQALRSADKRLTRSQIAHATGRTPGAVSRLLGKLKARGVVTVDGVGRYSKWGAA